MKKFLNSLIGRFGYQLVKKTYCPDYWDMGIETEPKFNKIYERVRAYTMTSKERCYALFQSIQYISKMRIPGDIVECGVWRGGSMMLTALTLLELGDLNRTLYLYDTFDGMSPPSDRDFDYGGKSASQGLIDLGISKYSEWCRAEIDEVLENLQSTGYPSDKIKTVEGRVEETIPSVLPLEVALLRLDTDWYESTKHELVNLYPILNKGGVLIIDDYGHWRGAKQATDEYFSALNQPILLNRIDSTGRITLKQ